MLDGASRWRIFRQLILPMSIAPLTTLAVLTYITMWKEYMWPLVVGDSDGTRVLTVALERVPLRARRRSRRRGPR